MKETKHIREIDGLRTIAVSSVLLFHCEIPGLPGGFTGVDIFFVISGYLISGMILQQISWGNFSFSTFYRRRIARIAPAMLVTTALTAAVFLMIYPPSQSERFKKEVMASLLSVSNFYFLEHTDYFSPSESSPLLHTWSLAVEEQFYILLPIFLWLQQKYLRRWTFACLALAMMGSFASSIQAEPLPGFYLPWHRAWEFIAGALLWHPALKNIPLTWGKILGPLGIILLGCGLMGIDKSVRFPGWWALIPVAGTCMALASIHSKGIHTQILANPLTDFIGKISYSTYLVHWPLCSLALLLNVLGNPLVKISIVIATLGISWLSWRFIEMPWRQKIASGRSSVAFSGLAVALSAALMGAWGLQALSDHVWRLSPEAVRVSDFLHSRDVDFKSGTCFIFPELPKDTRLDPTCLELKGAKKKILLMGDSHAANMNQTLRSEMQGAEILQATATGCKPVVDSTGDARCTALNHFLVSRWIPQNKDAISAIVISARWDRNDFEKLKATLMTLRQIVPHVIVIGPHPEYYIDFPLALSYEKILRIEVVQRFMRKDQYIVDADLRHVVHSLPPDNRAIYYSVIENTCPNSKCAKDIDGAPLMADRDHFTQAGSGLAFNALARLLDSLPPTERQPL